MNTWWIIMAGKWLATDMKNSVFCSLFSLGDYNAFPPLSRQVFYQTGNKICHAGDSPNYRSHIIHKLLDIHCHYQFDRVFTEQQSVTKVHPHLSGFTCWKSQFSCGNETVHTNTHFHCITDMFSLSLISQWRMF